MKIATILLVVLILAMPLTVLADTSSDLKTLGRNIITKAYQFEVKFGITIFRDAVLAYKSSSDASSTYNDMFQELGIDTSNCNINSCPDEAYSGYYCEGSVSKYTKIWYTCNTDGTCESHFQEYSTPCAGGCSEGQCIENPP